MFPVSLFICILMCIETLLAEPICEGKDGFICCSGFKWQEVSKKCIKCSPGYFGHSCSKVCSFPTYGDMCKNNCTCHKSSCSPEFGCIKETVQTIHTLTTSKHVATTSDGHASNADSNFKQLTSMIKSSSVKIQKFSSSASSTKEEQIKEQQFNYFEENVRHIIKSYVSSKPENEKRRTLSLATLIGVLAILFLVVLAFFMTLVQKGAKKFRSSKAKSMMSTDSDHYDNLNNIEQSLLFANAEGLIFEGLAEVRFNYDSEREHYLFGFKTGNGGQLLSSSKTVHNKIQTNETDGKSKTASIHKGTINLKERHVSTPEHSDDLEMRAKSMKPSASNPYLMAVSDDYLSDGASLEKENTGCPPN